MGSLHLLWPKSKRAKAKASWSKAEAERSATPLENLPAVHSEKRFLDSFMIVFLLYGKALNT